MYPGLISLYSATQHKWPTTWTPVYTRYHNASVSSHKANRTGPVSLSTLSLWNNPNSDENPQQRERTKTPCPTLDTHPPRGYNLKQQTQTHCQTRFTNAPLQPTRGRNLEPRDNSSIPSSSPPYVQAVTGNEVASTQRQESRPTP